MNQQQAEALLDTAQERKIYRQGLLKGQGGSLRQVARMFGYKNNCDFTTQHHRVMSKIHIRSQLW